MLETKNQNILLKIANPIIFKKSTPTLNGNSKTHNEAQ